MPELTFIIPTKNRSALLQETIESVVRQQCGNWLALVVDDGSTDESLDLVRGWQRRDGRIRLIQRPPDMPGGGSVCRNLGLAEVTSEFVVFLDSDDLVGPGCVGGRLAYMADRPFLDFAVFQAEAFHKVVGDLRVPFNSWKEGVADLDRFLRLDFPWQTTGPVWRTESLRKLGAWDGKLPSWQDWELHVRALCRGVRYEWVPTVDYYFRRHVSAERTNTHQRSSRDHLQISETMFAGVRDELVATGQMSNIRRQSLTGLAFLTALRFQAGHGTGESLASWRRAFKLGLCGASEWFFGALTLLAMGPAASRGLARRTIFEAYRRHICLCKTK